MEVLIVQGISRWLVGVHVSRLAPEKRPLARALQLKAEEILTSYFFKTDARQASQQAMPDTHAPLYTLRPEQREASQQQPALPAGEARSEASDEIKETLDGIRMEIRGIQHELRAKAARDEARLAALEGAQARAKAWLDRLEQRLAQMEQTLVDLTARPLAPVAYVTATDRLVAAVIARLLLLEERVSHLEPKPPPTKRGRPRRDRQR